MQSCKFFQKKSGTKSWLKWVSCDGDADAKQHRSTPFASLSFIFFDGGLEKGFYTALLLMDAKKKRFATSSHTLAIYIHVYVYMICYIFVLSFI